MEQRGCTHGAGAQRRLEGPLVPEAGALPSLQLGTRGLYVPPTGQAERAMLADHGVPQSCQVLPLGCLEKWIFSLEMAGQKPEAKSTAATRAVCRGMGDFGEEAHPNLREEQ